MSTGNRINFLNYCNLIFLHTVRKFGTIYGKKALHKILYFEDLESNDFSYRWEKFGPFSYELKFLFEDAVADGLLDINPIPLSTKDAIQYNMYLSNKGKEFLDKNSLDPEATNRIDQTYNFLKDQNPRSMELLASVHYLIRNNNCPVDANKIHGIIKSLKPKSGFKLSQVDEAISELRKNHLI